MALWPTQAITVGPTKARLVTHRKLRALSRISDPSLGRLQNRWTASGTSAVTRCKRRTLLMQTSVAHRLLLTTATILSHKRPTRL